ncbi:hypothetical protein CMI41_01570 [Candidatus Pacearchaeota archaeon]|nr:hypothetical protein [Candidatus Pacearchaeota archaeon]|tara:strand:- start:4069 stop:4377 length:309 start_codon:yes stop_codon:yes gene_type:complete
MESALYHITHRRGTASRDYADIIAKLFKRSDFLDSENYKNGSGVFDAVGLGDFAEIRTIGGPVSGRTLLLVESSRGSLPFIKKVKEYIESRHPDLTLHSADP